MRKINRPTVWVGIPAYNEEGNIISLLDSIFDQNQSNFTLQKVIIISDGSTDFTADLMRNYIKTHNKVEFFDDRKRVGKSERLNQIYKKNKGDLLLTLDGDVVLDRDIEISLMVETMYQHQGTVAVAGHQVSVESKGFIHKILQTQTHLWNETRVPVNGGDHIANLFGSATLLKKDFLKKVKYPKKITADEEYLYIIAKKQNGFAYCKNTRILCRTVDNIHELRLQASRFKSERFGLQKYFGEEVIEYHNIPIKYKVRALFKMFFRTPIFTLLAVFLSLWINHYPQIDYLNKKGMWLQAKSTKLKISRNQELSDTLSLKSPSNVWLMRLAIFLPIVIVTFVVVVGVVKGIPGNPNDQTLNEKYWIDNGPLELSPDRGRFALTYSIVENRSVWFSLPVARFATPDLGYKDGHYVSLFAPGVSFAVLPGYSLGRVFNVSQFGTYLTIALFAFINFWLIFAISSSLRAKRSSALLASSIFSFATPALAYGGSLYQHHISVFLILLSVWLLQKYKGAWPLLGVWFLVGFSIVIDYPNFFMMLPIGVYGLGRIVSIEKVKSKVSIKFKAVAIITFATMAIPLVGFMLFNKLSYGNPLQLAGTVKSVQIIDENGNPAKAETQKSENVEQLISEDLALKENEINSNLDSGSRSATKFFETRNMLSGFYTQFFSQDRGILFFAPVIIFGFLGIAVTYKKSNSIQHLLIAVLGANLVVYMMWGDPWGGWAFGSRYLIPAYAILAIFVSSILSRWNRNVLFLLIFYPVLIYSVGVNVIGSLTSNRNPPKVEILALEKITGIEEKYTVERNWDYLQKDSKSYVYRVFAKDKMSSLTYFYILTGLILAMTTGLLVLNYLDKTKRSK